MAEFLFGKLKLRVYSDRTNKIGVIMQTEEKLIILAKQGDLAAFEELVYLYEKPIYNYLLRMLGHSQNAEDATQDTFIKLFKSFKNVDPSRKFSSWVYKIATNTALDLIRKHKSAPTSDLTEEFDNISETDLTVDPYYMVEAVVDAEIIQKHLQKLSIIQRSVVLLYYYKDFSLNEISEQLNMPVGTIKTHLFRGRKALKQFIEIHHE